MRPNIIDGNDMKILAILFITIGLFAANVEANELTSEQEALIKAEIKQLVDAYAVYRDQRDAEGYASLFGEDGVFLFRGEAYSGKEVLEQRIRNTDPNTTLMHVMTSSLIEVIDENTATGVQYVSIYQKTSDQPRKPGQVLEVEGFDVTGKYHDKYILKEGGWQFAERSFEAVFKAPK